MAEKTATKKTASENLSGFLTKYRVAILSIVCLAAVAAIGYSAAVLVMSKLSEKGLDQIDSITYTLTNKSADLSESELTARRSAAMEKLAPLVKKGGVVGVRANMLAADLAFQSKDYKTSRTYWLAAAKAGRKSYTAPLAYYNAAVCSEELNDPDSAVSYYEKSAAAPDFFEADHALFSLGRVKEGKQDFKGAAAAYQKLQDKNSSDQWAQLAKTRLLALRIAGSIQ
jgi:tetratricopeptide (TPR) repeat protein